MFVDRQHSVLLARIVNDDNAKCFGFSMYLLTVWLPGCDR